MGGLDQWVAVALLGRARGIRGELTGVPLSTDFERFHALGRVHLFDAAGEPVGVFGVERVWFHDGKPVFKFSGVDSRTAAEPLQGAEVRIPREERRKLEPAEYFHSDLVGCEVVERATGQPLGRVTGWMDAGGAGLLEVEGGLLLPFAKSVCVSIDVQARRIEVVLPEGLKDVNRP